MSTPFFPIGNSMTIVATGTPSGYQVPTGATGAPNVLYVASNDPTNSAAINVGFGNIANAAMPTSGSSADGTGVVLGPKGTAMIRLNSQYQTGNLSISAVSDGTVRLFISQGVL